MKIKLLKTYLVFLLAIAFSNSAFSNYYNDSTVSCAVDPVIARLDSMSYSLFTRDKFFVSNNELLASINMPAEQLPRFSDAEIKEKMKLIPSMVPLTYNNQVKQFIDFFAYKRRGMMARSLANAQIYFPVFEEILDRKGLPMELKYLPIVESAFNPIAISRCGATGLWQLMYGTGAQLGLDINSYIDERRDPIKATEAAADYLKMLYNMYGDWHLVLAAYNSGPGNVNKAIARAGGVKNFWAIMNFLPAETRSYVPTYIAAVYVMNRYKDYKLVSQEPRRELYAVDTVLISAKVSLKHISNLLSIPEDELQFLNPSVKTGVVPYTQNGFPLNLPINFFALFEARKDEIMKDTSTMVRDYQPVFAKARTIWHKVKKNETISKIAAKYGTTVSSIKQLNHLKKAVVYNGQKIKIVLNPPSAPASSAYAQAFANKIIEKPIIDSVKTETAAVTADMVADTTITTATGGPIKLNKSCNCVYHVVQPGDTLWNIAERYRGVTIDKLKTDNRTLLSRPIRVGDIVKIFL